MHHNCRFVFCASMGNYLSIFFLILVILEDGEHMPVMLVSVSGIVGRTRKVEQWTNTFFSNIYGAMICLRVIDLRMFYKLKQILSARYFPDIQKKGGGAVLLTSTHDEKAEVYYLGFSFPSTFKDPFSQPSIQG